MATYSKHKLSGSTDGRFIDIAATSSPGTTIHQADPTLLDEIVLCAVNDDSSDRTLNIQFGDNADVLPFTIPAGAGVVLVIPQEAHCLLTNSLVVRGYADAANKIWVGGCVNRITN